jgi:anti-sigma factor RsiW
MTCRELVELVTEYLEGTLSAEESERFQQHLSICPGCQAYIEQMRSTIGALGSLSEESIDPRARDALLAAFRDWKSGAASR